MLEVDEGVAPAVLAWIQSHGGAALWRSVNLSNPDASWWTPALTEGLPTPKPTWQAAETPEVASRTCDVNVVMRREVKRFRVGLRVGSQGFTMKLTDGASRRLRRELVKAGEESRYRFDYDTQEAVILVKDKVVRMDEWALLRKEQG